MDRKAKGRNRWHGATLDTSKRYPHSSPSLKDFAATISRVFWVAGYALEDAREQYARRGHLYKQACACILLAALKTVRLA